MIGQEKYSPLSDRAMRTACGKNAARRTCPACRCGNSACGSRRGGCFPDPSSRKIPERGDGRSHPLYCRRILSAISAINSELVGFPLPVLMV